MSNGGQMPSLKPHVLNKIGALEKSPRRLWKNWGKELRNLRILARCFPVWNLLFNKPNICSKPLCFYRLNTRAGKMLFNILNKDSII